MTSGSRAELQRVAMVCSIVVPAKSGTHTPWLSAMEHEGRNLSTGCGYCAALQCGDYSGAGLAALVLNALPAWRSPWRARISARRVVGLGEESLRQILSPDSGSRSKLSLATSARNSGSLVISMKAARSSSTRSFGSPGGAANERPTSEGAPKISSTRRSSSFLARSIMRGRSARPAFFSRPV